MKKYINQIIRDLREDHDLSQKDIAAVLNIRQQVYSRYELGIRALPIDHLITLCQYYHVSADYILGLSKNKKPSDNPAFCRNTPAPAPQNSYPRSR